MAQTAIFADAIERWDPGSSNPPQVYGIWDDFFATNWNSGDPFCVANWRKRHNNAANALYLDGHVACADLRAERLNGTSFFTP